MQVDRLIDELIATGSMTEETLAELERMRSDDAAYLAALHARITGAPAPGDAPAEPEAAAAPEKLDGLTISEWRERALAAEAELAAQRDAAASDDPGLP